MMFKKTSSIPREKYGSPFFFDFEKKLKEVVNRESEAWYDRPNVIPPQFVKKRKFSFDFRAFIRLFKP